MCGVAADDRGSPILDLVSVDFVLADFVFVDVLVDAVLV